MPKLTKISYTFADDTGAVQAHKRVIVVTDGGSTPVRLFSKDGKSLGYNGDTDENGRFETYVQDGRGYTLILLEPSSFAELDRVSGLQPGQGAATVKEALRADRTYYVRKDGSNNNDGLTDTATGAFLTIQHAVDYVAERIDMGGRALTIKVGPGLYTESVQLKEVTGGRAAIVGDRTTPTNVEIRPASGESAAGARNRASWHLTGLYLNGSTIDQFGATLSADDYSQIIFDSLTLKGKAQSAVIRSSGRSMIQADRNVFEQTLTVLGTAADSVFLAYSGGFIDVQLNLFAIPDGLSVTDATASAGGGLSSISVYFNGTSGTITGKRYVATELSGITSFGSGVDHIPGTIAGTTDAKSAYDGA